MDTASRVLFIDAVCIDQDNLAERAHHVGLMRDVYSKGCNKLIYLGDSETAEEEMAEMYKIHNEARDQTRNFVELYWKIFTSDLHWATSRTKLEVNVNWDLFARLWRNPWFSRIWVIQEAALATNNMCKYGPVSFPLLHLLRTELWRAYNESALSRPEFRLLAVPLIARPLYSLITKDATDLLSTTERLIVYHALNLGRDLMARDPRDKVYGVLGLMECVSSGGKIPDELQPDHNKAVQHVFRDAIRFALAEGHGKYTNDEFWKLYHRSHRELETLTAPSWVPPMKPSTGRGSLATFFGVSDGLSQPRHEPLGIGDDLIVRHGMSLGKTAMVLDKHINTYIHRQDWSVLLAWLVEVHSLSKDCLPEVVASTLLAGRNFYLEPVKPLDLTVRTVHREQLLTQHHMPLLIEPLGTSNSMTLQGSFHLVSAVVARTCSKRRIFKPEDGQLGLGPRAMRPGDFVVVFYGCRVPYVLRPWGEHYKILGAC